MYLNLILHFFPSSNTSPFQTTPKLYEGMEQVGISFRANWYDQIWLLPKNPEVENLSKSTSRNTSSSKVSLAEERRNGFSRSEVKPGDNRYGYDKTEKTSRWSAKCQKSAREPQTLLDSERKARVGV